jgi:hypothetical protein
MMLRAENARNTGAIGISGGIHVETEGKIPGFCRRSLHRTTGDSAR